MSKNAELQAEFLLKDVMDFSANDVTLHKKRIWRMRFLLDGVLTEARLKADSGLQWPEAKNNDLLATAFIFYEDVFHKIFESIAPPKRPRSAQRVQGYRHAHNIFHEMRLIGKLTPIDNKKVVEASAVSNESLLNQLKSSLSSYQKSWFIASSRNDQTDELLTKLLNTRPDEATLNFLDTIKNHKLAVMKQDQALNQTRWFKLNRSGRSRYYQTLNQMQDIVMKQLASQRSTTSSVPEYLAFVKKDLQDHLEVFDKAITLYLEKEKNTKHTLFIKRHTRKKDALQGLPENVASLVEKNPEDISGEDIQNLLRTLEGKQKYLPGELNVVFKEVLQRAQAMQNIPTSDLKTTIHHPS